MKRRKLIKQIVFTALFIALGVVIPLAIHTIPQAGTIFLPMHLPVFLCGLICGPLFGIFCGFAAVSLSTFLTGMPSVAVYPGMVFELMVYGLLSGILIRVINTKHKYLNIYLTLIISMICGRITSGVINAFIVHTANYSLQIWLTTSFVTSIPGLIIQLSLIPTLFNTLVKANAVKIDNENIFGIYDENKVAKSSTFFFDNISSSWDDMENISEEEIEKLLSVCDIQPGERVLDLACGTGILEPYLQSKKADIVGLDISSKMIDIAKSKHSNVVYECGDFYNYKSIGFSKIIIFNAYPHFVDKDGFSQKLNDVLAKNGKFYIIHNESRYKINAYHGNSIRTISSDLEEVDIESKHFEKYFNIEKTIDNADEYLIVGSKKD